MPKRTDIETILLIGAGPIVIGQACEFDYSGSQACKALKEEGYRVVLVNSNPATVMTDPEMADAIYIEPIEWSVIAKIIEKERPDVLLPTMGGQTALNVALDLERHGILERFNVEMIGADRETIDKAEDREKFDQCMKKIGLNTPPSGIAHNLEEAFAVQEDLGFPCVVRPSFTLGGSGGGIAYNRDEFIDICQRGLDLSPTSELLIDKSLLGWKEFEMEVVRDKADNCIIVCAIENFDPMGIHTGDSITVAPAQTLTDKEYQQLRNYSFDVVREIGVETGGANVQFAISPEDGSVVVIEMNPRVSRSSALASKATGFPIAKVAAKLAIGYTLDEILNDITKVTPASFEPSLDYVVVKIPRFTFEKFAQADDRLTTQMRSVGEAMGIGVTFQHALQKAMRSLENSVMGFDSQLDFSALEDKKITSILMAELRYAGPDRLWFIGDALRFGFTVEEIYNLTFIDPWFLENIADLIQEEGKLAATTLQQLTENDWLSLKRKGFSDVRIASLLKTSETKVREARLSLSVAPVYKRIDTCAAEFDTSTAYLYSTYETFCESRTSEARKVIVIGGGPNRIGQGIEFDYCCVHAVLALKERGFETIMINCNPETVSTDFDISDRLYFEPVTLEDVLSIIHLEKPYGVIVQFGGQTPLKLVAALKDANVNILGTSPEAIDCAENRERFQEIVEKLQLKQPQNRTVQSVDEALEAVNSIPFPVVVRPSYVLGGRAMEIVHNREELLHYLGEAFAVSNDAPVLIDQFLDQAIEVDVDLVSDGKTPVIGAVMQHIEQAGVHSGDSACVFPSDQLPESIYNGLVRQSKQLALELGIVGLMNVQFAIHAGEIYIIETNPRASRTIPFVSKCIGKSLAKLAVYSMLGSSLEESGFTSELIPSYVSVKESVFPFAKFPEVDPILLPEMRSTGEVMGVGFSFAEAFAKAYLATGMALPKPGGCAFLSVREVDRTQVFLDMAKKLVGLGFSLLATRGTAAVLQEEGIEVEVVNKVIEGRPDITDFLKNDSIDFIVNTTEGRKAMQDSAIIRRLALKQKVCYATTLSGGLAFCEAMACSDCSQVRSLQHLYASA